MFYILLIFIPARGLFSAVFTHGIHSKGLQKQHYFSVLELYLLISPDT